MRSMARIERFLERLVERPTARVFRARLQPVQVLRRIEREMEGARRRVGGRSVAPDRFLVRLAARDVAGLGSADVVAEHLASGALAFAKAHDLALLDRPRVLLEVDVTAHPGEIRVEAAFSAGDSSAAGAVADPPVGEPAAGVGGTRVYDVPGSVGPTAALDIAEPGRSPRRVPLPSRPTVIGRGAGCDVLLADAHASRRHARVDVRGGVYVLADLGSTNGLRVNGRAVREVVLGIGDRIELGQTVLRVVTSDMPIAGGRSGR